MLGIVASILWQRVTHTTNICNLFLTLFHISSGMRFSTKDKENEKSPEYQCALKFKGAWWYSRCHDSNLNGIYYGGPHTKTYADGVCRRQFRGLQYSLKRTEMKLRPRIMKK